MRAIKILCFLCFLSTVVFCQQTENSQIAALIKHIENIYGTDNRLVNGESYFEKTALTKGHPYLGDEHWTKGTVCVAGTCFDSVVVKYNIEIGQLILKYRFQDDHFTKIILNESLVDSFHIHHTTFVHSRFFSSDKAFATYYEPIYRNKLVFLKTHKKAYSTRYVNNAPKGYYSASEIDYYLGIKGVFYKTNRKKTLLKHFPDFRKEINKYCRKKKNKFRKANKQELHNLIRYCEKLSKN
jgi:hypothetical protein